MKNILTSFFLAAFIFTISAYAQDSTKKDQKVHSYVGVDNCGMCHKTEKQGNQLGVWKGTRHSNAFKTLLSDAALKIAKDKGLAAPPSESEECLKCHVSGFNLDKSLLGAKFSITDGVQCETCHGPGSDYKAAKIMKDRKEAVANGLMFYEKPEELCVKCHNEESPTFKGFNFEEMWSKVKHPVAAK